MESLDLTYDTLFKIYFKSKECFNYLISIVSELLKIDKEYVRKNLKILDSEIITENANKKYKKGKRLKKLEKYLLYLFMTRYDKNEINEFIKGDEVLMEAEKIRDDLIKRETIRFYYDQELDEMIEKKK